MKRIDKNGYLLEQDELEQDELEETPVAEQTTEPLNPLKKLRLDLSTTQIGMAIDCGVSGAFIMKNEQGLYYHPATSLVRILCQRHGIREDFVVEEYVNWQKLHRFSAGSNAPVAEALNRSVKNWAELRNRVNRSLQGFCRDLCVHPSQMAIFEKRPGALPFWLEEALLDCKNVTQKDIYDLNEQLERS
jgi:hypothetical protein